MKKIKTLFKRDYGGTWKVYDELQPGTEWVQQGEGVATRKWDGTACMVRDGVLYKRYNRKQKGGEIKPAPWSWEPAQPEPNEHTGDWPGWVPVGEGPEDQYHREAFEGDEPDGTYELVGPKVQGNPEGFDEHVLIPHGEHPLPDAPRTYDALRAWLKARDIEGIVWHHPDGRMAKIKTRDFGPPRDSQKTAPSELPMDVRAKLLKLRDALVEEDLDIVIPRDAVIAVAEEMIDEALRLEQHWVESNDPNIKNRLYGRAQALREYATRLKKACAV